MNSSNTTIVVAMPTAGGRANYINKSLESIVDSARNSNSLRQLGICVFLNGCIDSTPKVVDEMKNKYPDIEWVIKSGSKKLQPDLSYLTVFNLAVSLQSDLVISSGDDDLWLPQAFRSWNDGFASGSSFLLSNFGRLSLDSGDLLEKNVVKGNLTTLKTLSKNAFMFEPLPLGSLHRSRLTLAINNLAIGWRSSELRKAIKLIKNSDNFDSLIMQSNFVQCFINAVVLAESNKGCYISEPIVTYGVNERPTMWRPDLWKIFNKDYLDWIKKFGFSNEGIKMTRFLQRNYEKNEYHAGGKFRTSTQELTDYLINMTWYNTLVSPNI